jgi:hypothetical protein
MSSKVEIIKKFNSILGDFLNQVSPLIGESYNTKFKMITKVNSTYSIKRFCTYALEHEDEIMSKNPEYFMNDNIYKDKIEENYGDDSEKYMDKILQFKEIYKKVDSESQENLWSIIQALLILSKEYKKLSE